MEANHPRKVQPLIGLVIVPETKADVLGSRPRIEQAPDFATLHPGYVLSLKEGSYG